MQIARHGARALETAATHARKACGQVLVPGIDAQPEDVHGAAAPGHRDLDAVDELHALVQRRRARVVEARKLVVVGQGPYCDAGARGAPRNLGRSERAVGNVRVAVQVDIHGADRNSSRRCATCSGWS